MIPSVVKRFLSWPILYDKWHANLEKKKRNRFKTLWIHSTIEIIYVLLAGEHQHHNLIHICVFWVENFSVWFTFLLQVYPTDVSRAQLKMSTFSKFEFFFSISNKIYVTKNDAIIEEGNFFYMRNNKSVTWLNPSTFFAIVSWDGWSVEFNDLFHRFCFIENEWSK